MRLHEEVLQEMSARRACCEAVIWCSTESNLASNAASALLTVLSITTCNSLLIVDIVEWTFGVGSRVLVA